jgi:hypothetical protein
MSGSNPYALVFVIAAIAIGLAVWRRQRAREIAEQWLARNRYRVRSLRVSYWGSPGLFKLTPFRNTDWAVDFRAEVDDTRLGGTGKIRLRVWTDWVGMMEREPEISWDRMPTDEPGAPPSTDMSWAESQLAVLRRVVDGETTFRPDGRDPAVRRAFDDTVEHVMALQRRGLLTCATPIAELKADAQYAAVTNLELTDAGRAALDKAAKDAAAAAAARANQIPY